MGVGVVGLAGGTLFDPVGLRASGGDRLASGRRRLGRYGLGSLAGAGGSCLLLRAIGGCGPRRSRPLLLRRRGHPKARLPERLLGEREPLAGDLELALGDEIHAVVGLGPAARLPQLLSRDPLLLALIALGGPCVLQCFSVMLLSLVACALLM